uniref:Uncharacterized protein n=1 Tax=Arundo donax TaxID=35708 RepID=A0A0A9C377_ARUDO
MTSRQETGGPVTAACAGRRRGGLLHGGLALAAPLGLGRRLWGRVDDKGAAAGWAGGVSAEPSVDAGDVEPVAALRQDADLLLLRELRQADGAVGQDLLFSGHRRRPPARSDGGCHGVLVGQLRQRPERPLPEPLARRGGRAPRAGGPAAA